MSLPPQLQFANQLLFGLTHHPSPRQGNKSGIRYPHSSTKQQQKELKRLARGEDRGQFIKSSNK